MINGDHEYYLQIEEAQEEIAAVGNLLSQHERNSNGKKPAEVVDTENRVI